jgi:hypothetical protein
MGTIRLIMEHADNRPNLPDANQLSVLVAVILLAYALTPFIKVPEQGFKLPLPGVMFEFEFNFPTLVSYLVAALAAFGTDWLLRGRLDVERTQSFQHWILPALTAWLIGFPLRSLEFGLQWWAVFSLGGLLLIIVFIAEYIVVDFSDRYYAPASAALVAVSFAVFLFLSITMRASGLRLYIILPALAFSITLVSLRTLYLRLGGQWRFPWALLIGLVVGQFAVGFHYLPLNPLSFGLLLLGPAYALISLATQILEKQQLTWAWIEPVIMLTVFWVLGFTIRL